jgi:hypothetical protein
VPDLRLDQAKPLDRLHNNLMNLPIIATNV